MPAKKTVKTAAKKTTARKEAAPKKETVKKAAPAKETVKKEAAPKKEAVKKAAPKKETVKKAEPKKEAVKKAPAKKTPAKKTAKKPAAKKATAKKAAPKKTEEKKTVVNKKSVKDYEDIINWKKGEAHAMDWLYIEINAGDLLTEVEAGVDNLDTACNAILNCMLEGDGFIVDPPEPDKVSETLTVRYYCDNLSEDRKKYFER